MPDGSGRSPRLIRDGSAFALSNQDHHGELAVKLPYRKEFLWPLLGIAGGAMIANNPFFVPLLTFGAGTTVLFVTLALILGLSWHPAGTRTAAVLAGLAMLAPCFVRDSSFVRAFLMIAMAIPLFLSTALVLVPPSAGWRARLAYVSTWGGTQSVRRVPRRFDATALIQLVAATAVFAASLVVIKNSSDTVPWRIARWLAGGIMILAFAEMATAAPAFFAAGLGRDIPPLMRSPYLSTSINEFWTRRWNLFASRMIFRAWCFQPLARRGIGIGLFAAFTVSAVAHALLAFMAFGRWGISLIVGAFFLVQPFFILAERRLNVRRWRMPAQRLWALSALAIASPLFVEPLLHMIEQSGCLSGPVLPLALVVVGYVMAISAVVALASLACGPVGVKAGFWSADTPPVR
jgi:hypothetical protein